MPALRKVETNRQNAQLSTGPVTEEGKQRSSRNAVPHGFTGQTLVLTPEEQEAYEAHIASYFAQYEPSGHEETDLLQQYADLRWSLHQISVQQQNLMALMNAITRQFAASGDPSQPLPRSPLTPKPSTLSPSTNNGAASPRTTPWPGFAASATTAKAPPRSLSFGFVCSNRQIEEFLEQQIREKDLEQELENYQEEIGDD